MKKIKFLREHMNILTPGMDLIPPPPQLTPPIPFIFIIDSFNLFFV
jgi:hypothetical protein